MRPYEEMTDEKRCEVGAGLHYKSREWDEIFNAGGNWDGAWPEINRRGLLTGRIVGNEGGYLNVNDEAMISEAEADAGGWTRPDDGYAEPPARPWPTIRNCNFASRDDERGRIVLDAVKTADSGCDDCNLIGSLDALEAVLARHAESDSAEADEACTEAEDDVVAALLVIAESFDKEDRSNAR